MSAPAAEAPPSSGSSQPPLPVRRELSGYRRTPRWILACVGVSGLFLALAGLGDALGGGPGGPTSSSYATGAKGLAAWAELLSHTGHPVERLRASLDTAVLSPDDTVVILDPEAVLHSQGRRLLTFVHAGGRLIFGGDEPQGSLPALFPTSPEWIEASPLRETPARGDRATTRNVSEVRSAGEGQWASYAGYQAPLRSAGGVGLLLERSLGRGRIELLADASPLQNRLLASAGNAQFALNLAGASGRTVVFVESVHGYGDSSGLRAVPASWWLMFAGLTLAGLLWILGRRRLGPAEPAVAIEPPPRSDYTDALTLLLRRTRDDDGIAAALTQLRDGR
jgi:hypothetical protein